MPRKISDLPPSSAIGNYWKPLMSSAARCCRARARLRALENCGVQDPRLVRGRTFHWACAEPAGMPENEPRSRLCAAWIADFHPTGPLPIREVGASPHGMPDIRYAKSGNVRIAYQVTGGGPLDVVFFLVSSRTSKHGGTNRMGASPFPPGGVLAPYPFRQARYRSFGCHLRHCRS